MLASSLRPLMAALRLRSARRRLDRRQLLKLVADASRLGMRVAPSRAWQKRNAADADWS
jgi:hypothetical protein